MTKFDPIKVTRGTISAESAKGVVHGRDRLIKSFWNKVESSSLRVLSERRTGKTWMLRLAESEQPEWASTLFIDVETCENLEQFVSLLNSELHNRGLVKKAWYQGARDWLRKTLLGHQQQNTENEAEKIAQSVTRSIENWKTFLISTLDHWGEECGDKNPVLIIDELPFFLDKLQKINSSKAAELLDTLRWIRQNQPNMRMIFCGSLGLHIVLDKLHAQDYVGQPVNDMPPFEVPPLDQMDAFMLAGGLLVGEKIHGENIEQLAKEIATHASQIPFYIQHLINWMGDNPSNNPQGWRANDVDAAVLSLFHAAGDPGEFVYYEKRIHDYYPPAFVEKAFGILDTLSHEPAGYAQQPLINLLRHNPKLLTLDDEDIIKTLRTLKDDHYIVQQGQQWRFKLEIVRRWWFDQRGNLN